MALSPSEIGSLRFGDLLAFDNHPETAYPFVRFDSTELRAELSHNGITYGPYLLADLHLFNKRRDPEPVTASVFWDLIDSKRK